MRDRPVYSQTLMHSEFDYQWMIEGRFRECLSGCAACGLLRKNVPQSSCLSGAGQISSSRICEAPPSPTLLKIPTSSPKRRAARTRRSDVSALGRMRDSWSRSSGSLIGTQHIKHFQRQRCSGQRSNFCVVIGGGNFDQVHANQVDAFQPADNLERSI